MNEIIEIKKGTFLKLTRLTKLLLNDNKITYLGSSVFDGLTYLSTLHLDNNLLSDIEENSFSSLKFLRGLFLGMNNLTTLSGCLFYGLQSVVVIDASRNQLQSISDDSFLACPTLQKLYLNNNNLTTIGARVFSSLSNLKVLDLSNNRISITHRTSFSTLYNLQELNLLGNQFDCNSQNLTRLMSLKTGNRIIVTCIIHMRIFEENRHPVSPSTFVTGARRKWSQWGEIPTYNANDSKLHSCSPVTRIRKRTCVSCKEAPRPWCINVLPSPEHRQRCVSIIAKKTYDTSTQECSFSEYPDRTTDSTSTMRNRVDIISSTQRCTSSTSNTTNDIKKATNIKWLHKVASIMGVLFCVVIIATCWCRARAILLQLIFLMKIILMAIHALMM